MCYIHEGKGDKPESFLELKGFTLELGRRVKYTTNCNRRSGKE